MDLTLRFQAEGSSLQDTVVVFSCCRSHYKLSSTTCIPSFIILFLLSEVGLLVMISSIIIL